MTVRVLISAGEVSGDQHLARVVRALKHDMPHCEIRGMAGRECAAAGAHIDVDCYRTGATMGFSELLRSARSLFASFATIKGLVTTWKPHVVVLVDYPGFNLRLAKAAHAAGAKVLYYIPPKVWAWKAGRVKTMKRFVDHVAAIFPFEKAFFARYGYDAVTYVGHPLAEVAPQVSAVDSRSYTLLLLPGSRRFEVERMLPPMLRVYARLRGERPALKATVLVAPNMSREWLREIAGTCVDESALSSIDWKSGDALHEAAHAHAAILKSGTCNLEGALALTPFVSVYSGSRLSKVIVSLMVPLQEYSPVNIVRPGTVKEVMQVTIDEDALHASTAAILDDGETRRGVIQGLQEVRAKLLASDDADSTGSTVSARVSALITELAAQNRQGRTG